MTRSPLTGLRVQLSGSIPQESSSDQANGIAQFVFLFASRLFSEGGTLIHGSHPSLIAPLERAARIFIEKGGDKDSLTLVRAQKFSESEEHLDEINKLRQFASVFIVPTNEDNDKSELLPMRAWMSGRSDTIVCIGGRANVENKQSGVSEELDAMLFLGKPGFAVGGFGGAIGNYLKQSPDLLANLQNGLPLDINQEISASTNIDWLIEKIISQLKLLPLVQQNISQSRNFRILALDGGGIRGAFTAAVLATWDDMIKSGGGNDLVKHFDLVAGTSTGAILAIGLGLGLTPLEILNFYKKEGEKIFPKDRKLRHWLTSKHKSTTLREVLTTVFGDSKLTDDSCCKLVIPTVRAIHGEAEVIVTAHTPDRMGYRDISAVDAALASSAAPTYFDQFVKGGPIAREEFLDGGIWANNPILPALAEAVRYLNIPLDRIDVLNVGTLGNELDFRKSLGRGRLVWASQIADLCFAAQERAAEMMADSFLGPVRHLRINQQTPSKIALDNAKAIDELASRGLNVGKDSFVAVRSRFLDGSLAPDWQLEH